MVKVKHDILSYCKHKIFISPAICDYSQKIIISGYLFVDKVTEKEVWLDSDTGYKYLITVPDFMENVISGSQFNVSIPFQKVEKDGQIIVN